MPYLPILTYHRILPGEPTPAADPKRISVGASQFESHLRWLRRFGYRTISLDGYVEALRGGTPPAPKAFAITFDDGYAELSTIGLPLLRRYGFVATVFAVSGEATNRWDDGRATLLSHDELRAWKAAGMDVGAHTAHHARLPAVDQAQAKREIAESKKQLEDLLQQPVPLFAYPYGEYSPAVMSAAQDAGFSAAFATDRASADHAANLYALRRAVVFPSNGAWNILWKAQRWYPAYQDRRRTKGS